jgi:hypothetical protein
MKTTLFALVISAIVAGVACDPGPHVVLNERTFSLPSMASLSTSCMSFDLGRLSGDGMPSFEGADQTPALVLRNATGSEEVVIFVTERSNIVAKRVYDASFFNAGKVDEFTATATTGEAMLVRTWGSDDSAGPLQCAPFSDSGPSPSP